MIKEMKFTPRVAIFILSVLYAVGIVGILIPIHPQFILLTPANLLISVTLALYFHESWKPITYWFIGVAYVVGFSAEVFGVQTGILFGDYQYGPVLGWKVWDTPLMIGVNWVMLGYSAGIVANHIIGDKHWLFRGLLAAILMVALDVLIEPVAIAYNFWSWDLTEVPLQNYVGWFLVALPIECFFAYGHAGQRNKVAVALFILQVIFFSVLNI
jgi:putative membrane protein